MNAANESVKFPGKPRIVIIGGGFSGAYCAKQLDRCLKDSADVLIIDRHNYFVFYPLLVEASTGMLAPTHAVVGIRSFVKTARFLMAELIDVDTAANTIRVKLPDEDVRTIPYDHLVLALGSITKFPPVPGLKQFAYEIKNLPQTIALRDRAVQLLEEADSTDDVERKKWLLHFVVVGGSYTGIEVAAEYHSYMREAAKIYPRLDPSMVKMTVVDRNDRVLSTLPETLSHWAATRLAKRGVEMKLKNSVTEVREDRVRLQTGEWIPCSTVIWAAGIAPPPILEKLNLPLDHGWLVCETDGRVKGMQNVWGIGDAAINPDPKDGKGFPATAQHAVQEGTECGKNISRVLKNKPTEPMNVKTRGTLTPLGHYDGVALVFGFKVKGFLAWALWRGFYLSKMPGIRRALHVFTDWIAAILFGRTFVEVGVHRIVRAAQEAGNADAASVTPASPHPNPTEKQETVSTIPVGKTSPEGAVPAPVPAPAAAH